MNMMIREKAKKMVALLLALVLAVTGINFGGGAVISAKAEESVEPSPKAVSENSNTVRGVLDDIDELPQYKKSISTDKRGTAEQPFVILEIVPYKEYSELGYLVGGCEPVKVEELFTNSEFASLVNGTLKSAEAVQSSGTTYFFLDEKQGKKEYYTETNIKWEERLVTSEITHNGYYEYVGEGNGIFELVETVPEDEESTEITGSTESSETAESIEDSTDGSEESTEAEIILEMKKVEAGKGSYVWHTINECERKYYDESINFTDEFTDDEPQIGDRIYTTRVSSKDDKVINVGGYYYTYKNNEVFLKNTLQLSDEDAANYSVVIKTITPAELNDTPDWVDYADLIYIYHISHNAGIVDAWKTELPGDLGVANRLGLEPSEEYLSNAFELDDISAEVVLKIFDRVTATDNYAGIIIDSKLKDLTTDAYTSLSKKGVRTLNVYDWNLDNVGEYTIGNAPTTVTKEEEKTYTLNFTKSVNTDKFFSYKGGTGSGDSITYNGEKLKKYLKLNDDEAVISFTTDEKAKLTIIFSNGYSGYISIDGTAYSVENGKFTVELNKGNHYIKRYSYGQWKWNWDRLKYEWITVTYNSNIYYLSVNTKKVTQEEVGGGELSSNNNIYKLCVMLFSIEPNLLKQIHLNSGVWPHKEPVITINDKGELVNTLQTGDGQQYWCGMTLHLYDEELLRSKYSNTPYQYSNAEVNFETMGMCGNISEQKYKDYVSGHVFSYNSDNSLTIAYTTGNLGINADLCKDFYSTLDSGKNPTPTDAIRYILGLVGEPKYYGEGKTIKVLDVEPSVGLAYNNKPDWELTETYIQKLLPRYTGKIELTHQTTAEFIGKTEDLNSEYDLIYFGLDIGAYNTKTSKVTFNSGADSWGHTVTDFNDNSMDGKIYFHIGDSMVGTKYITTNNNRSRSVEFLYSVATGTTVAGEALRFPGNDISKIKYSQLESYVNSGKPVVAEGYLYDLEKFFIDESSNIYSFVNTYRNTDTDVLGVYSTTDTKRLESSVKNNFDYVTFNILPALYNGATESDNSADITNPNYLPTVNGSVYLKFGFNVPSEGYYYCIYVDQDRDSKYTADEIVKGGLANKGYNLCTYELASSIVGIVQWKIEVYRLDNPNVRSTEMGSSAVEIRTTAEKKTIKVLQIMPKSGNYNGALNLQTSELFKKYYSALNDFKITVRTITWKDFEQYFEGSGFSYDMSKPISTDEDNPNPTDVLEVLDEKGETKKSELDGEVLGKLSSYNMIIVGFGDAYGTTDMNNNNHAVEYLQYYSELGKSILYTHDITSMYNVKYKGVKTFGYTANAMMRDLMGMNRYKGVSNELTDAMRSIIIEYQKDKDYDTINSELKQGFTYYAMKRLGWINNQTSSANTNYGLDEYGNKTYNKVPYKYMITNPQGNAVVSENTVSQSTGFSNTNDITTTATKLNEGQITTYPYTIPDKLNIAPTHGQWYQLNMEDPEVTVWYCLSDPAASGDTGTGSARTTSSAGSVDGTALTYGVSPNDAANNYYIYSKGNIFYSGVGHSTVTGDIEAKLFINTMIAAYRISYDTSKVIVEAAQLTNERAGSQGSVFDLSVTKKTAIDYTTDVPDDYAEYIRVYFRPEDTNFSNDINVRISFVGTSEYIQEIWTAEADVDEPANTAHIASPDDNLFENLKNDKLYYFYCSKNDLRTIGNQLMFEVFNNRSEDIGLTYLKLSLHTLYNLD